VPVLLESAGGLVVASLVVLAWYGAGASLVRLIDGTWCARTRLQLATACALGAGAWSLAWFFVGLAGGYRASIAFTAAVLGLALAGAALLRTRGAGAATEPDLAPPAATARVPVALTVIALAAAALAALAPPTAKDALQYHAALPKAFIEAGRLTVVGESIASYFPLGVEMNGLWAMLLGRVVSDRVGEAAFGATTFAFLPILLAFVHGWTAERAGRSWAPFTVALVATVPAVYDVAVSGYVDLALALYLAIAVRAAARWCVTGARRELALLAPALGFAAGVKVLALFPFALLGLVALIGARRAGRGLAPVAAALAAAGLVGAPWYVRTWRLTGSPFFPHYLDLWPGAAPGWDVARSVMARAFNSAYGGDRDVLGLLLLPFRLGLMGQREMPAFYESVLGAGALVAAALAAWALWRRRLDPETTIVAIVACVMFAWWASSAQVLRYLLPAVPLAMVVAGRAAAVVAEDAGAARWVRAALLAPAGAALVVLLAWFVIDAPMLVVTGAEPRAEYLARRLDYYPYYRLIDERLARDARVWLIDVRRDTYHLARPYRGDYLFEDYTLRRQLEAGAAAAGLRRWAREAGITHVFIRHDLLFDEQRSPLVDDRRPREENAARLARLRAFLLEDTRVLGAGPKFLLVALP
jgi:hypothetical protein